MGATQSQPGEIDISVQRGQNRNQEKVVLALNLPPVCCVSSSYSCSAAAHLSKALLREGAVWRGRNCIGFGDQHLQV